MILAKLSVLFFLFAGTDNIVEWNGVSHVDWQDRRPLCPVDGEPFSVLIQAFQNDLTGMRVRMDDGSVTWVSGFASHNRGPYTVWQADLPATAATNLNYYFELSDGVDVDYYSVSGMSDALPTDGGFVIDYNTLEHAPLGATLVSGGGAVFKVWAPNPTKCVVSAAWNGFVPSAVAGADSLTKIGEFFVGRAPAAQDGDEYRYIFRPGVISKPDPRGRALNPAINYNARIEDPLRYAWTTSDFTPAAFADLVIYQLHVGTFSGRNDPVASGSIPGTYRDVAAHVGHFEELGINCVYVMPITEFSSDFSAGYNPNSMWGLESAYGEPDDLKYMVDTLHAHGIAVIYDAVWNHFDGANNFLWLYDDFATQIYFQQPDVQTPWGSQADFTNNNVRSYFLDSLNLWLEEYRLDGIRADGTDFMNIFPQEAEGWSLMQALNDRVDNRMVDKFMMAEQLPDDSWVTRPTASGGAGFDSQLHDWFIDNLRQEILDAALGDPEMWRIADIIDGSGVNLKKRRVVNYLESHDEAWPQSGGTRLVNLIDPSAPHNDLFAKGRTKLGYGVVFYAQGIPMILQGTEWLESTDFGSGNTGGADRINWNKKNTQKNIFRYFRDALKVKNTNPALRATSPITVFHVNEAGNVIAWHRTDNAGNDLVIVANFSNTDQASYSLGFPIIGDWYEILNAQESKYAGSGMTNPGPIAAGAPGQDGLPAKATIQIPAMGLHVFRFNDPPVIPPCPTDFNGDLETGLADLAIVLANFGRTGVGPSEGDSDGDGDVDLSDLARVLAEFGRLCP